jgi:acyl-CoA thioesterase FadM
LIERTSEPQGIVADGWTGHACVNSETLRPTRMPAWLAEAIAGVELQAG